MGAQTVDEATTIDAAVMNALRAAGVAENSPIKQALTHDAQVYDLVEVCVPNEDGKSVSLADRLAQMRLDPRWKGEFPEKKPTPSSGRPVAHVEANAGATLSPDRAHFDGIVSGAVRVEAGR